MGLIQTFKDIFMKPDVSDQERVERWRTEVDEADRLKTLHRKSRKQDKEAKKAEEATRMPISAPYKREKKGKELESARQEGVSRAKGLTIEDFEKAEQAKKKKPKRKPVTYSL